MANEEKIKGLKAEIYDMIREQAAHQNKMQKIGADILDKESEITKLQSGKV